MDSSFFQEELRSGFLVTTERKKLWAVQLDLLKQFDAFCKEYHVTYFAQGGTLLGAARHKGYIPWDDDIDLMMLWDDYQVLLKEGPHYFTGNYFLQNYLTEKEGEPQLSKLRRSDTTGCTQWELDCVTPPYNKGIFIDIFPFFNVPDDEEERLCQVEEISYYWKLYKGYEVDREKQLNHGISKLEKKYDEYEKLYLTQFPRLSFAEIRTRYVEACAKKQERTSTVAPLSFRSNEAKTRWRREWFDEIVYLPFEDMLLPCPKQYCDMLECQYGDWRVPVMGTAIHEFSVVDSEMPYGEKLAVRSDLPALVRPYTSKDYEGVSTLLRETYKSVFTERELQDQYLSKEKEILVSVLNNNTVVGCAFLNYQQDHVFIGRTAFVTYVAARNLAGIVTQLLTEIEKIAKYHDCGALVFTRTDNSAEVIRFIESLPNVKKENAALIEEI